MVNNAQQNREKFHPHGNNLDTKIRNGVVATIAFKEDYYMPFVEQMAKIKFKTKKLEEFEKACSLIDDYYASLSEFAKDNNIKAQSGIKSSFIEEISKYLFLKHPIVVKEKLLFENSDICTGMFFSKDTLKTTSKNVDFCICREKKIKMGNDNPLLVRVPIISVECKTYLDGTMFNEVIDTATRLHISSPDSTNIVFMLWNDVGKETFTVRRKATNIFEFFSLMKKPSNDFEKSNIKTDPKVLLAYYCTVSNALDEYFKEYHFPSYGQYLHK